MMSLIRKHIIENITNEQKAQNQISENRIVTMTRNALIFLGEPLQCFIYGNFLML